MSRYIISWSISGSCWEKHYKDMQDIEFTIQEGKLFMLQTRNGKRTIFSWLRSQVEMVEEGLISKEVAVSRVPAGEVQQTICSGT